MTWRGSRLEVREIEVRICTLLLATTGTPDRSSLQVRSHASSEKRKEERRREYTVIIIWGVQRTEDKGQWIPKMNDA